MLIDSKYLRQFLAANIVSIILFVCACWVAWPSSVNKKLYIGNKDVDGIGLRLDETQITWVVSLLDLGTAVSPLFSSYFINSIGRKNALLIVSLFFLPTWLMVWDSTSFTYVCIARFLIGFGKGLSFTAVPVYINEISDHTVRGMLGSSVHTSMTLGLLFSLCVGPYISYTALNTIFSVIPLLFLSLFVFMPESPYYYIMKKNYTAAEKSLRWFRPYDTNIERNLKAMVDNHERLDKGASYWKMITHRNTIRPLLIVTVVAFLQRMSGITALVAYSSTTLPELSFTWFGPNECIILFTLLMTITNFSCASFMDIMGRKLLLCISVSCGIVLMSLFSMYYYVYPKPSHSYIDLIPYVVFVTYGMCFLGMGNVPPTLPSEYFNTSQRTYASATASVGFAVGSFLTSKFYLIVQRDCGSHVVFLIFAIVHVFYLLVGLFFVQETKGKTLEEIQAKFYKTRSPTGEDNIAFYKSNSTINTIIENNITKL
ncbi:facilitated trehalose transporter Tret1-like [Diaphorina citri]|uniref:Facilitated trehalose transporter Tret1-like n=1 Tax=Diaphorina citri TaxID=121845 RepID=A0A1S3DTI3_DIACI|nr:facilitated trehalose transporter Tret1-like [Diaphorina citri]